MAQVLMRNKDVFILTGAGISAESGIPTFQGTNWRGLSHYDLANIEAWERDPALVWQYYSDRRTKARDAKPNAAHLALAEWDKELKDKPFLCTQNVDGLHEAAGSEDVVHIHGKLFESRCAEDCGVPAFADFNSYSAENLPRCACGALARPNVCWFGEQPYHLDRISHALDACKLFLAIGTSGSVQPVASFVNMIKQRPIPATTIYVGLEAPANVNAFDQVHLGKASQVLPQVLHSFGK